MATTDLKSSGLNENQNTINMKKSIFLTLALICISIIAVSAQVPVDVSESELPAWVKIALAVLGGLSVFLGGAYLFIRSRAARLKTALYEVGDIFSTIETATADNNISEDEFKGIVAQSKKAWGAIKNIFAN